MEDKIIMGNSIDNWIEKHPELSHIMQYNPVYWQNNQVMKISAIKNDLPLQLSDVIDAEKRWERFASIIKSLFPEMENRQGIIESELIEIDKMKVALEKDYNLMLSGKLFLKLDSHLPIAGSIKARGGFYEVLKHAETLAIEHRLLSIEEDYAKLANEEMKQFYSQYGLSVGSTGNLGLSIGIIGTALGFQVTIHMSADAKEWKKQLLRDKGAKVIEYTSDYSQAVTEGRKQALADPKTYFIDDEQSIDLFLGYSVAAVRLKKQLKEQQIEVNEDHPLYVYIPCGVGGAPGGICFGLKMVFGDVAHCIFAEPTHSPSMLMGLLTGLHHNLHISDFGLDNITEADGLAVGSASKFVGKMMEKLLDGVFTVDDDDLFRLLALLNKTENIKVEPSAAAGFMGPFQLLKNNALQENNTVHVIWATGGALVPDAIMQDFLKKGESLNNK